MSKISYPSVIVPKKALTANVSKKTPNVFTVVFVPHSQKQSRSVNISMKAVYTVCMLILTSIIIFTGHNVYANRLNSRNLATVISHSSSLEVEKDKMSDLSEELRRHIRSLTEENRVLSEKNDNLSNELSQTETQIDALITQAGEAIKRLEQLSDSESKIRQQVGLKEKGGVGGPNLHSYNVDGNMSLDDKLDYAEYLIENIAQYLTYTEQSWNNLKNDLDNYYSAREHTPHIWPVAADSKRTITSFYGWREDPFSSGYEYHEGIDIADDRGTDILASASGTVTEAKTDSGFGNTIVIDHGNGYTTRYSHCSRLLVKAGDKVTQGELIAYMGSSGRSTGSHLDFRVYINEKTINPMKILDPLK